MAVIISMVFYSMLTAGNTGKIAGEIIDKETGEPLPGAEIFLTDTYLGAATDENGFFYIIGIPPGTYELQASYVGFHKLTIQNVIVQVDLTTSIDVELESELIESPAIVITAEKELVQKDVTSTRRVTTAEEISRAPGIESVTDILTLRAGVSFDQVPIRLPLDGGSQLQVQDESLKNIHIRGGRGGEILYMVDGMPVTHPIYGGREVLDLNIEEVQQMELLTGAFSAEYGQAQSGVVNITTRSGSSNFEAGAEFKSDLDATYMHSHRSQYVSAYLGGPLKFFSLTEPLGKFYYFLSGNLRRSDGAFKLFRYPNTISLAGLDLRARQDNTGNLNGKLTWELSQKSKFIFSYHGSWKRWTVLPSDTKWLFKFYPNNTAQYLRDTQNFNMRFNQILSKNTFLNINLGYLGVKYNASLDGESNPADFWVITKGASGQDSAYTTVKPPQLDRATLFYNGEGYEATWRDDLTKSYTLKAEITSQIHTEHTIKSGASVQYHDLKYVDIQDGAYKLSNYGEWKYNNGDYFDPPPGPFPEFGQNRWVFLNKPLIGDIYIQDKFEKENLIINVGVRLDWMYLGDELNDPTYKDKWHSATGISTDWDLFKYAISQRFGVSFPILETTVLFFSYGHFNQLPQLQFYYRDPWSGGFTGNPHMGYEKTILYEFGLTHQISTFWTIDLKSYGKDISDQVGTETLKAALGIPVSLWTNNGYGRARGFEVELNKTYSNYSYLNLTYALQWANGYSSSAYGDYIRTSGNLPKPIRERPLSWDIRHQVMLNASLISMPGDHPSLFGIPLPDNWQISLLMRFASGRPYTPGTFDYLERRVRENGENMPYTISSDLKISKSFEQPFGSVTIFLDIFSLFNRRNAVYVNDWTGEPLKYGDVKGGEKEIYSSREMNASLNPNWWTPPRRVQFGLRFNY